MPGIKRRKKEPLNKGSSNIILKLCSRAMLMPAKSNKKRAR